MTLFITAVLIVVLAYFYPMLFGKWAYGITPVPAGWWGILVFQLCRKVQKLEKDDFTIRKVCIVNKETSVDSDGDTTYYIIFSGVNSNNRRMVRRKEYESAKVGTTVYNV